MDAELAGFLETALSEVCFGDGAVDAAIDRYFAADYQQTTDGETIDRDGFAAHIAALRGLVATGRVRVLEAIRDGDRIADRHLVSVTRMDGIATELEVYMFAELAADGRVRRVHEVSRVASGGAADGELARAR